MPDTALQGVERQFMALLAATGSDHSVIVIPFAFPEILRNDWGRKYVEEHYFDIGELWESDLDALIVTGAEPRTQSLRNETYWPRLAEVLDWAHEREKSLVLSCLAAHAAVLHLDGIPREPLSDKRFGVYGHEVVGGPLFTWDMTPRLKIPHSRWNDLPAGALAAAGYQILTQSPEAGVDCFVKSQSRLWLFFQGHPEYESDSLLKEYHRDVRRFLTRERETYPGLPNDYFTPKIADLLAKFRERAIASRDEALMVDFPLVHAISAPVNTWRQSAAAIYRNWLDYLVEARRPS
jgi:homoserine O-succinyltransferase/O-acetyltransferase